MRSKITLLAALVIAIGSISGPARADDEWFEKWDHNHDRKWSWDEFRRAQYRWWKEHRDEHRCNDKELREHFKELDRDHDGYLYPDDVRSFHHW